jgi:hypothetical protein
MALTVSPELVRLFETYTGHPDSLAAHLAALTTREVRDDPLIVATGTDVVIFPGAGRDPEVQGFRLSTRGFKELAGISHLPPAVSSLVKMRALDPDGTLWRREAARLLQATETARKANSAALWRDVIAVEAYAGREQKIAEMVDYTCTVTERYLRLVLEDDSLLTPEGHRADYLEGRGRDIGATVPMNAVMVATFFLVGLDISHRIIRWFKRHEIDWSRAMVLITGRAGRTTAGVTIATNSVCATIVGCSNYRLPLDRIYIAPHAPAISVGSPVDIEAVRAFEEPLRQLWAYTRTMSELGPLMFDGYPRYWPAGAAPPVMTADTTEVSEMPAIESPTDWRALTTRLRVVLEDPRQLLSGCVTDYAVKQLTEHDNDPARVVVPGLDGVVYPPLEARPNA